MKWVTIGNAHWNTDLVKAFSWGAGKLLVWWEDEPEGPEYYKDPTGLLYRSMCRCLGIVPQEVAANGEG